MNNTPSEIDISQHLSANNGVNNAHEDGSETQRLVNEEIQSTIGQSERILSPEQIEQLLITLKDRFEKNVRRHSGIEWSKVVERLNNAAPEKLWSLSKMEETGGEPDVVGIDEKTGELEFYDCSLKSPFGRRNVCYDRDGQKMAEKHGGKPEGNAKDMAKAMGLGGILNAEQNDKLDSFGMIDRDTWSWIDTSEDIRTRGFALRVGRDRYHYVIYARVEHTPPGFFYENLGFRGWLKI